MVEFPLETFQSKYFVSDNQPYHNACSDGQQVYER